MTTVFSVMVDEMNAAGRAALDLASNLKTATREAKSATDALEEAKGAADTTAGRTSASEGSGNNARGSSSSVISEITTGLVQQEGRRT